MEQQGQQKQKSELESDPMVDHSQHGVMMVLVDLVVAKRK